MRLKKIHFFAIILFIMLVVIQGISNNLLVARPSLKIYADELENEVDKQLGDLDLSGVDQIIGEYEEITQGTSFKEIVKSIVSGNYKTDYGSTFKFIINSFVKQISSVLPIMITIIVLAIFSSLLSSFKPSMNSKSINQLISLVCYCLVVILIVGVMTNVFSTTKSTLSSMTSQMEVMFPILLTLLTATGGLVSVGIYTPMVSVLTTGVSSIFSKILYPIFFIAFILEIVGHLSDTIKLSKMSKFLSSLFKWSVGLIFTLFAGILTVQGISAGKYDSVSLKATKFTMKNAIPIVGGYLSDGLDYVLLSSVLIKNAVGVGGLLILLALIISPIMKIVLLKLALQLTAGILEPISNGKISNFCESCSKVMIYPLVIILSISFMYFLSIGLIMCTMAGV